VPLWLFLLCLLLGALVSVSFGWFVRRTMLGATQNESLGNAALAVAAFPSLAKASLKTLDEDADVRVRVPRTGLDLSDFHPVRMRAGIHVEGLRVRADPAALARAPGWRILIGGFSIDGKLENAALALSPELEVVKMWPLVEKPLPGAKPLTVYDKFIHGVAILDDASIVYGFDYGVSLQRIDACGKRLWAVPGKFDHAVSVADGGKFLWTLEHSEQIVKIDTADGRILQRISMNDIAAANPTVDILEVRQQDWDRGNDNSRNLPVVWDDDPFHLNDVEPLPAAMAQAFKGFQAGDLLVSARSLDLIFVLDPQTLKVRWWHSGSWRRQHDPDWEPTGKITVFDNHMNGPFSRIVSIVPGTSEVNTVFDGRNNDFYSRIRGKHQATGAGTLLITSPQQGRVFEVERDGHEVFEIVNTRPGRGEFNYPLSDTIWFPSDTALFKEGVPCANPVSSASGSR
jgi:hypothetical protein